MKLMTMGGEAETWTEMRKMVEEVESESCGSSEAETESPRSVGRWATKERLHLQVLKVKEEDLCVLFEDKTEIDRRCLHTGRLNFLLISRPNLPCSPLSGKVRSVNAVK